MGRRATGSVFTRGESIRVQFQWQGKRVSETLYGLSALRPKDLQTAERILADIVQRIGNGTFDYATTFPDSPRAAVAQSGIRTLGEALDAFMLNAGQTLAARTLAQYRNACEEWREILGTDLVLAKAIPSEIEAKIFGTAWSSAARFNNALIPLRGAVRAARKDNPSLPDLLEGVANMSKDEGDPDPLTPAETAKVLAHVRETYPLQVWAWYSFAFATGLRPSEQAVLLHSDIVGERAHISKAQDMDGTVKATKTKGKRVVDLAPLALEAVKVSASWKNDGGEIFQNPWSGQPWRGNKSQHENVWTPTLKALGIAARRAYCTRHTFATTLLAHGARVAYVSSQMGHTSPSMVEKTYARWLPDGDGGHSRAVLVGAFS